MKKACFVVCSNGLGHVRRVLPVVQALVARVEGLEACITGATWQLDALLRWPVLRSLKLNPRVTFQLMETYPRWTLETEYYRNDQLMTWHRSLEALNLDRYDLVVSDNLIEVLNYAPRAVMMGSFLWHDIYSAQFPDEPLVQDYGKRSKELVAGNKPAMIANRYFVMPAVREQTTAVEVGMLDPLLARRADRANGDRSILCLGSSIRPAEEILRGLARSLSPSLSGSSTRLLVDDRLARDLAPSNGFGIFDHDRDNFSTANVVVARPGLGVITDCITTATPLFCAYEPNVEMEHNAGVLERMGLGWKLESPEEGAGRIVEFTRDERALERYSDSVAQVDRCGLNQTVEYLMSCLE